MAWNTKRKSGVSGSNLLLDTNAFIHFFEGRQRITDLITEANTIYYSPISEIELLSASHLSATQIGQIKQFLSMCDRVEISPDVVAHTIQIRRLYNQKIPDAIIAASAVVVNSPLVTADADFQKVESLQLIGDILG